MPDGLAKCLVARLAFYAVKHLWRLFFPEPAARSRSPFSPGLTDPGDHGAHGATDGAYDDPFGCAVRDENEGATADRRRGVTHHHRQKRWLCNILMV